MTKATTRKPSTNKASTTKAPEPDAPMDPSPQGASVETTYMTPYEAYALQTLVAEVGEVYPDATYTAHTENGWGVSLGATFQGVDSDAYDVLALLSGDVRIQTIEATEAGNPRVVLINDPARYDLRDEFGFDKASRILAGGGEPDTEPVAENADETPDDSTPTE